MENIGYNVEENTPQKPQRKPTFLVVLVVLSAFYIFMGVIGSGKALFSGPLSEDDLEEQMGQIYSSIGQLEEQGVMLGLVDVLHQVIDNSTYINNNTFYLNSLLTLLTYIIGAIAVFFMLNLRKLGFHLYILYSILPVVILYVVTPSNLVPNIYVIFYMVFAILFSLLYGLNLKHMK